MSSRLGDTFVVHRDGIDLECLVVMTGRTYLFDPDTADPIPSSLNDGASRQPAKPTSHGKAKRQGISYMSLTPSAAPISWGS